MAITPEESGIFPQPPVERLDQFRDRISYTLYSLRTKQFYVQWVKRAILKQRSI